ncbi:MAG: DUF4391 domain-containing protein [Bacilli bacterium]|nr:DUF4391 domain-containing protein [Bacilli bacterium]
MLQFPPSTQKHTRLPKESFYAQMNLTNELKRSFVEDIESIIWSNILTSDSLNTGKSDVVKQIDVLNVSLKKRDCNYKIFEAIEKIIPRHLLFVLKHDNDVQLLVHYKEEHENAKNKYRILQCYKTEWEKAENVYLNISGLDLERIYHNFVYQIAGNKLQKEPEIDISEAVDRSIEKEKIRKQIERLEAKKRKENQFNIQIEISNKIKELKKIL